MTCPQRIVCCEPGMKACGRPLHQWFYKGLEYRSQDQPAAVNEEKQEQYDAQSLESKADINTGALIESNDLVHTKQEVLFRGNQVKISLNMTKDVGIFGNMRIKNATDADDRSVCSTSSVYFEGNAMKFREKVRMLACEKHCMNPLMAAIRYGDELLAEHIAHLVEESADIDQENVFGDTALTLACRSGMLNFVQLLVQHGADLNKETFNGRTALIESIKCTTEHIPMVEYLLKEGCMVAYKTAKHGRTALDWARRYNASDTMAYEEHRLNQLKAKKMRLDELRALRKIERGGVSSDEGSSDDSSADESDSSSQSSTPRSRSGEAYITEENGEDVLMELTEEQRRLMGRPRTVRILELAFIVQQQCNIMFQKIAMGENNYIINIIKDGDFFDVQNEEKAYKQMERHIDLAQEADRDIIALQQKMNGLSDKIDSAQAKYKSLLRQLQAAEEKVDGCINLEKDVDGLINKYFSEFERLAVKVNAVDVEEIHRVANPPLQLQLAMYAYGIVFNLFNSTANERGGASMNMGSSFRNYDPTNTVISMAEVENSFAVWFPWVKKQLTKSTDTLRLLQTFSRAKLHVDRHKQLFIQTKQLLDAFVALFKSDSNVLALNFDDFVDCIVTTSGYDSPRSGGNSGFNSPSSSMRISRANDSMISSSFRNSPKQIVSPEKRDRFAQTPPGSASITGSPIPSPLKDTTPSAKLEDTIFPSEQVDQVTIADHEWDSDAEDPDGGGGYWEKGEWVPVIRKKSDWWKNKRNDSKQASATSTFALGASSEKKGTPLKASRSRLASSVSLLDQNKSSKLVVISDELIQEEKQKTLQDIAGRNTSKALVVQDGSGIMEEDFVTNTVNVIKQKPNNSTINMEELSRVPTPGLPDRQLSRSASTISRGKKKGGKSSKSSRKSKRRESTSGDRPYDKLCMDNGDVDANVGAIFINAVIHMLKAIFVFSTDHEILMARKQQTLQAVGAADDLKALLQQALEVYNKEFGYRSGLEQSYIKLLKKSQFNRSKVTLYTNKVRICRLLNYVCVNGHTAISYAASYGNFPLVEELLSRGASVGYTADMIIQVVKFLQYSWRIYRLTLKAREQLKRSNTPGSAEIAQAVAAEEEAAKARDAVAKPADEEDTSDHIDPLQVFAASKAHYITIVREIEVMKEKRKKILTVVIFNRQKNRLPIPESVYMGHWEIAQRIYDRRLWHMYFTYTFAFPLPHIPFLRQSEYQYSHTKRNLQDVMAHALDHMASGVYTADEGWLPPGHVREPYGDMLQHINSILETINERNMRTVAAKQRLRLINVSKINMRIYEQKLLQLIYSRSFDKAMDLITTRGINVDLETPDGQTLLIAASDENVHALNHTYILNAELRPVLLVEFLLDRYTFRPNINYETKIGLTALLRACVSGREDIVVALLNRGAKINYLNKHHKSVLHYAAMYGHGHIVKLLLERQVDVQLLDADGKTAYGIAEELNFVDIMTVLSQYASGNFGALSYTRGNINNHVSCPLGCGVRLYSYMKAAHVAEECECRYLACPNGCSCEVMCKELGYHTEHDCVRRLVTCEHCQEMVIREDLAAHKTDTCIFRDAACTHAGCDKRVLFKDLEMHLRNCPHKLVLCPLICNTYVEEVQRENHVNNHCMNRRVACPLKCRNMIIFKHLAEHMEIVCSMRIITCPNCQISLEKKQLEYHITNHCDLRNVPCPNKCDEVIKFNDISSHMAQRCARRYVACPLLCELQVQAQFLPAHMDNDCVNRMLTCRFHCVQDDDLPDDKQVACRFPHKILAFHELYDCPNRLIRCSLCNEQVVAKRKLHHELYECVKRMVACSNSSAGCTKHMPWDKLAHHLSSQCKSRDILCPLGCQLYVPCNQKLSHIQNQCEQRFIDCPLGCRTQVKVALIMAHIAEDCVRRHLTQVCYNNTGMQRSQSAADVHKAAAVDVNSMLTSMTVTDKPTGPPSVDVKLKMRREETHRVNRIKAELRMSEEVRSKLVSAVRASSGAKMVH